MNVRKKLIEILKTKYDHFCDQCGINKDSKYTENLASYLIANGVTVQEWISVDDRLPEDDSDVLACSRIGEESRIYPACYSNGVWFDCVFNAPATDTTTHWMPIPNPPKGE